MHSSQLFAAALAFGSAAAQSSASTCTSDIEISQATPVIDCDVVAGSITVKEDVSGQLTINGPKQIKGDLTIKNASAVLSISSTTINAIGGTLTLEELNSLNSISLSSLQSIDTLSMIKLNRLGDVTFGSEGITKAKKVVITDTDLDDMSGFKFTSVDSLQIDNNKRLIKYDSSLQNVTDELIINTNGNDMDITLNDLEIAGEIQIRNAKSFKVPALQSVTKSLKLDSNPNLESFFAPNLTNVTNAVSLINNDKLANVSIPLLKMISGDLTIVNNTNLSAIDGLGKLETVLGGIDLGGNFEKVELPSLKKVAGSVSVASTTDIKDFCKFFDDAQGGIISGQENCTSNDANAVQGSGNTQDGNGGGNNNTTHDAAGMVGVNTALMGLAVLIGIAQVL